MLPVINKTTCRPPIRSGAQGDRGIIGIEAHHAAWERQDRGASLSCSGNRSAFHRRVVIRCAASGADH